MLKLYIGNKNYSSWSMRPWVLLTQAGIPFEEVMVRFDSFDAHSQFKKTMASVSPTGKVPALVDGSVDGDLKIWDTLAIAEYVAEYAAEQFPDKNLWPKDKAARAIARSVCAEMHAGFTGLRGNCPMNIEASLPEIGQLVWRDKPAVQADVQRIVELWSGLLEKHGGPMLFGDFSAADAYFAPVCMRFNTYQLPLPAHIAGYVARVTALPSVQKWIQEALREKDFVVMDEPYRVEAS
jgi:glutathione S-transferase